jgi:outer membrane immunogenic protein
VQYWAGLLPAVIVSAASAADLPVKAPAYAAPAASPWSGFYLGGGLGFRASETSETFAAESIGGGPLLPASAVTPNAATSEPLNGIALRGNLFAGYNFQVTPRWVLGIEGDVGFADQTTNFAGRPFPNQGFATFSPADGIAERTKWDASARARLGFLVTPATLVYATGGAAWQHFDLSTSCKSALCASSFLLGLPFGNNTLTPALTDSAVTRLGWTVGGGVETSLGGHWFARADYRFADFGPTTFTITRISTFVPFNPIVDTANVPLRTHTVSLGLAYKFGDEVAPSGASTGWLDGVLPVKAPAMKAPAASLWNGFYVGAGLGLRANDSGVTTTAAADAVVVGFSPTNTTNEPLDGTAFRGAPYIGWNWQIAPRWVAGVEGDVGVANQTTSLQGFGFSPGVPAFELAKVDSFALRTTWDASARARVGYLVTPATLLYATGGAAWQHFDVNSACVSAGCGGSTPIVVTDSLTKTGWTAGSAQRRCCPATGLPAPSIAMRVLRRRPSPLPGSSQARRCLRISTSPCAHIPRRSASAINSAVCRLLPIKVECRGRHSVSTISTPATALIAPAICGDT